MIHRVRRGLQVPLAGEPEPTIDSGRSVSHVAILGDDYVGLRPGFRVEPGATVRRGDLLFEDKTTPGVRFTSTVEGRVTAINRGARRAFQSIVIELSDAERRGRGVQVSFESFTGSVGSALTRDAVRALLLESGLWTALRARPFSRVADPQVTPRSIFVTAADSEPLAPDVELVMAGRERDLEAGLRGLSRLTDGPVFVCTSDRFALPIPQLDRVQHERFAGPHPAGTVGFHIHTLDPAGRGRIVWHAHVQDVLAMGRLFRTGELDDTRVIALAGPAATRPRLLRVRLGASIDELTRGEYADTEVRLVSGSALTGRTARGSVFGYLGRYHRQVCVLREGRERALLGWAGPGLARYSAIGIYLSAWVRGRRARFDLTTSTNGSERAIVPIGAYERVMPFDTEPTYLLKALLTKDLERAEQLGALELDEDDVALCTFVCPGKHEYGRHLRDVLTAIEKEG